jgi:hypothetical protein
MFTFLAIFMLFYWYTIFGRTKNYPIVGLSVRLKATDEASHWTYKVNTPTNIYQYSSFLPGNHKEIVAYQRWTHSTPPALYLSIHTYTRAWVRYKILLESWALSQIKLCKRNKHLSGDLQFLQCDAMSRTLNRNLPKYF